MMDRKKILPEDLLQRTNIQQHNFMIDAINEIDERQGTVEDITATNTADVAILKDDLIALSNEHKDDIITLSNEHRDDFIALSNVKLDKESVNADLHFGEITLTREGTSVIASMDVLNPVTGLITPISFTIPGATSSMAGVMPADDAAWIAEAEGRISALEGMSDVKAIVGLPEDPTQAEITGAWMSETSRAPATGDLAQDVSNGKLWIFVDDRWVLHGVVVTVPVATTTSLGGVKDTALGAPANRWYCHVEADGRVALIGGDSLSTLLDTTIPAMQGELALKADKAEVDTELALKADKAEVDTELALKADKTEVALKADKTEVALKADKTEVALKADKTEVALKADKLVLIGTHDIPSSGTLNIGSVYANRRVYVEVLYSHSGDYTSSSASGVIYIRRDDSSSIIFGGNTDAAPRRVVFHTAVVTDECTLKIEYLKVVSTSVKWTQLDLSNVRVLVYAMD